MTRHIFPATAFLSEDEKDVPVNVVIGWDRPLQGFFMIVSHGDREEDIYNNLDDEANPGRMGFTPDVSHYRRKLQDLDIEIPPAVSRALKLDQEENRGNLTVVYNQEGLPLAGESTAVTRGAGPSEE